MYKRQVWEWCANADYDEERITHGGVAVRALRGGSWGNDARIARSAYRHATSPVNASLYIGFRFALRSTSALG